MQRIFPPELKRLDATSGESVPKYARLSQAMLAAVANNHWRQGDRLPTEQALAKALPFSLGTIQRALRVLVNAGVLVRHHRSGTFVAAQKRAMEQPWHCRFLDDDGASILPIYPKILLRKLIQRRGPWTRHLGACPQGIIQIDRAIDINAEFCVYSKFYVDAARFRNLLDRPLGQLEHANFKLLLGREFHTPVIAFVQTLSTVMLPRGVCQAMELPVSTTGCVLEAGALAPRNVPVYFQQLFIPPNSRRLVLGDSQAFRAQGLSAPNQGDAR
jgi:GntR family transcriptional regulator